SRSVLARRIPRVSGAGIGLPMLAMVIAAVAGAGVGRVVISVIDSVTNWSGPVTSALLLAIAAVVMLPVYVAIARVLRIHEVTDLVAMVTSKLPGGARRA
ncbi:MAG: putative peptidoglycan lipid flippase, partial [Actinomycetota bacterium]|nr:putative peptidoglycan lipid flippase [Actinomycetota bacterium]